VLNTTRFEERNVKYVKRFCVNTCIGTSVMI